jgi:hypothetical protein
MNWLTAWLVVAVVAAASPARAQAPAAFCQDPLKPMLRYELYFGRDVHGHHLVSDRQWAQFLADEVTPAFPEGLTVFDGRGQWRGANATVMRERTKIVVIVTSDSGGVRGRVAAVIAAYKARFEQHSVGVVQHQVCAAF